MLTDEFSSHLFVLSQLLRMFVQIHDGFANAAVLQCFWRYSWKLHTTTASAVQLADYSQPSQSVTSSFRTSETLKIHDTYQDIFQLVDPASTTKKYRNEMLENLHNKTDICLAGDNDIFKADKDGVSFPLTTSQIHHYFNIHNILTLGTNLLISREQASILRNFRKSWRPAQYSCSQPTLSSSIDQPECHSC